MKQLENEETIKYNARDWKERLRDLTICPDCLTVQKNKKSVGDECDNDCGGYISTWKEKPISSTEFVERMCGDTPARGNRRLVNLFGGEQCTKNEFTMEELKKILHKNTRTLRNVKDLDSFWGRRKFKKLIKTLIKRGVKCNYYECYRLYQKSNGKYSFYYEDVSGLPPG